MKWKCEVKHRGKRYELVENDFGCFGCAFLTTKKKCKLPFGFPSCSVELVLAHNSDGNLVFERDMSRVWRLVEK